MTSSLSLIFLIAFTFINTPLEVYKWKKRVVIVYANDQNLSSKQEKLATADKQGYDDRHLVVFKLDKTTGADPSGHPLSHNDHEWLLRNYISESAAFYFILIGKDGHIKLKSNTPVGNSKLFDLIDSMPMRIQEMKNGQ